MRTGLQVMGVTTDFRFAVPMRTRCTLSTYRQRYLHADNRKPVRICTASSLWRASSRAERHATMAGNHHRHARHSLASALDPMTAPPVTGDATTGPRG
jgi:hypothetical protein